MGLPKNYGRANNPNGLGGRPRLNFEVAKNLHIYLDKTTHKNIQFHAMKFKCSYAEAARRLLRVKIWHVREQAPSELQHKHQVEVCERCKNPKSKHEHTCDRYRQLAQAQEPEISPFDASSPLRAKGAEVLKQLETLL